MQVHIGDSYVYIQQIDGQKRNLPLTLGNGSLNFYPSGSSVVLETNFGLVLQYDWKHHLQVAVGPELFGVLCGLCGNASHSSSDGVITSDGTQTMAAGSYTEECGGGVSCPVCIQSQTKSFPGSEGSSLRILHDLLQRRGGPFADCHPYIDPISFVSNYVNSLHIQGAGTSMCKVLTSYTNICQRHGGKLQNWRANTKCRESRTISF